MKTNDAGELLFQEEDAAATHMAGELLIHLEAIKALNWEPATNRKELAERRAECVTLLDALHAHMLLTNSIAPITPAERITYDAAARKEEQ